MLHAILFLHCDRCHRMYDKRLTTIYSDPHEWQGEFRALAAKAAKVGWYVPTSWQNLLCRACHEESRNAEF